MKIVFDSNVLISGFLTATGPAQHVLSRSLKSHEVILSEYLLHEYEEKLIKKLRFAPDLVKDSVSFLKRRTLLINSAAAAPAAFNDKKDLPILGLLQASRAHYFITGDKRLLAMKKFGSTLFLSPREAMEII